MHISKDAETYFALFGAYRSVSMLAHPGRDATTSSQPAHKASKAAKSAKKVSAPLLMHWARSDVWYHVQK
jgi:hypothetical protein